jgi:hypothetical protein
MGELAAAAPEGGSTSTHYDNFPTFVLLGRGMSPSARARLQGAICSPRPQTAVHGCISFVRLFIFAFISL